MSDSSSARPYPPSGGSIVMGYKLLVELMRRDPLLMQQAVTHQIALSEAIDVSPQELNTFLLEVNTNLGIDRLGRLAANVLL